MFIRMLVIDLYVIILLLLALIFIPDTYYAPDKNTLGYHGVPLNK